MLYKRFVFAEIILPYNTKKAVSAYFTSEKILPFGFAEQSSRARYNSGLKPDQHYTNTRVYTVNLFFTGALTWYLPDRSWLLVGVHIGCT